MLSGFVAADAKRFLERLLIPEGHFLEIRVIAPDRGVIEQRFCCTHEEALACVREHAGKANVYVGASPRSRRLGKREAVTVVICAWADLDFHQLDRSDRGRAEHIARERIDTYMHPPTMVVHTGNGLQVWWIFERRYVIGEEYSAEYFEGVNRGVAKALGGDTVHDLARVLRVPGTMNLPDAKKRARGCVQVMARLIHTDGPTYAPEDFSSIAIAEPKADLQPRRPTPLAQPTQSDVEIVEAFTKLLAELGSGHPLVRTWRGDRFLKDMTGSGFDMALMYHLVACRIREEFVPAIVRAYRGRRGQQTRDAYIARTLASARAFWRTRHGR